MRHLRQAGAALTMLLVASSVALAQRAPARQSSQARLWELGGDAAVRMGLDDPNTTTFDVPVQNLRAGFFLTPEWSLEPFFAFSYLDNEAQPDATTQYQFGAGAVYHFSTSRARRQFYARPHVSVVGASFGGASNSEVAMGAGVGFKLPQWNGRLAVRGEAGLTRLFDSEQTVVNVLFGLSFYNR